MMSALGQAKHQNGRRAIIKHLRTHAVALCLLVVLAAQLVVSVRRQSLSWDEGDHIFAGYESWKKAEFGLNPEHPPLVKELATLPLLAMGLRTPPNKGLAFFKDEAYLDGRDLIYGQDGGLAEANRIIFAARMAAGCLSLVLAGLVYAAAFEMFGGVAALVALSIVVFEPNLIAHGAYVTTDMGITCFLFATVYALYRFRERATWQRLIVLGLATGMALAVKHSAVLLLPIAGLLGCFEVAFAARERRAAVARQYGAAFAGALLLGVTILWATYGFRFSSHPGGGAMTPSFAEYIAPLHGFEPKVYLLLARMHVLPESYLYGLGDIRMLSVAATSFPTYLLGQIHAHGVWYYFPVALVVKSTAGFMLLVLVAIFAVGSGRLRGRRVAFLAIPPAVYLLIALGTGLNIGARHLLPIYPFLAVLVGGTVVAMARVHRGWGYAAAVLLGWHGVSTLHAAPNYLAYSNEFWGGPSQTHRYLTDSNVDWGQQLVSVKAYLDRNGITDCWFGYFVQPSIDYKAYGIPCRQMPTADSMWTHQQVDIPETISGTVLISASTLTGYEFGSSVLSPFQPFVGLEPVAVIDRGVNVYRGTFDTRFAAAFGHMTRATALLAEKKNVEARAEAERAVAVDPEVFQAQMILGDALAALGDSVGSGAAYDRAEAIAGRMEPSAKVDWVKTIGEKRKAAAGR